MSIRSAEPPGPGGPSSLTAPCTVVIPSWNGCDLLRDCLDALTLQSVRPQEIIVVDNASSDGTGEYLRSEWPNVSVLELTSNQGFAAACNAGIRLASKDNDIVLLNNDTMPRADWLEHLTTAARRADAGVGAFGSKLVRPDGTLDTTGDFISWWGIPFQRGHAETDSGQYDERRWIFAACGGGVLLRRALLDDVGELDERFFAYYEDVDLCFRARLHGWNIEYVPTAVVVHIGGATSSRVSGFQRYHTSRNIWFLLLKNLPAGVLATILPRTICLQAKWLAGAARHRQFRIALRGHVDAIRALPSVLRDRRSIAAARVVSARQVRSWLAVRDAADRTAAELKPSV